MKTMVLKPFLISLYMYYLHQVHCVVQPTYLGKKILVYLAQHLTKDILDKYFCQMLGEKKWLTKPLTKP